ncbi:MAG: hypothetical protein LLF76_02330 [Planctomycetaceae bacterium]|nr:hypothetical protein [Planctomycetaceae bacterium]
MSKLQDLIAKLPDDLQPMAVIYGNLWIDATAAQLQHLTDLLVDGRISEASRFVVQHLSSDQLIAELERINAAILAVNQKQFDLIETQRQIIRDAIRVGIYILIAKAAPGGLN